jgi:outer membrane protein assembly factor BamB
VLTYHNDNARTGQNLGETLLALSSVNSASFGKIGTLPVTGLVDAEPLYVPNLTINGAAHNVLFVATEHDFVYAFDADNLAQLWQVSVAAGEASSDNRGCDQVTPEIGVTSTPVIDPGAGPHGTLFLVSMSKNARGQYHQRLHALDLVTHAELDGGPAEIQATYPTLSGKTAFDPAAYAERSALLLLNGVIYLSWTSHCDAGDYTGWIMGYSESTLQQTSVLNLTPNGSRGAIWMAGAGPASDSSGNIYILDANGTFDASLDPNGVPTKGDYGNAFVKLSTARHKLTVADYFAPFDTVADSDRDLDLGSGGALLLPDFKDDSGKTRRLAVGAGKVNAKGQAVIYVVNRDSMGKFNARSDAAIYQELPAALEGGTGVYGMPAYFNDTIYYGAVDDNLKALPISHARLANRAASETSVSFGYPGTTPSISANGAANGIVWAVEVSATGVLHAYDATNLAHELYNSNQAGARDHFPNNKFVTPMIANGRVYVGTQDGVAVFGLLNGAAH